MTVLAQAGLFGWGMQSAKGSIATTWYRHMAQDCNFGPVQDLRTFPLEVGGIITPTGGFKGGAFVGGGATLNPRLEGDIGWLLKGLMGNVATTGPTATSVYTHVFKFATDVTSLPWMSFRKYIPGSAPLGEIGLDCKVTSLRAAFPQNGIVSARVDALGREPSLAEAPSWTWADAAEAYGSVPLTCTAGGYVKFPASGGELPIVGLNVMMVNNLTTPQQEMVIGSQYPDDFVPVSRAATIQATLKWADPDLYQLILTNAAAGTAWDPTPYTSTFDVFVEAPNNIPSSSPATKFSLRIEAQSVMWAANGAPVLAGGDTVLLPVTGTVLEPTSGDYLKFTVLNGQTAYYRRPAMTTLGQAGVFSFGQQSAKGTIATTWYRHKAMDINLGAAQDLRTFPLECGGGLTPTGAYKAGAFSAGGATINPRLAGDIGWLLKGLMGKVVSTPGTLASSSVHAAINITIVADTTTGFTAPASARKIVLTTTGLSGTATVTFSGTDGQGGAINEVITINAATKITTKEYATVTSFNVTAAAAAGSTTLGDYETNSHVFTFDSADLSSVPWMSARKYIPGTGTNPFAESCKDLKVGGLRLNLPPNGILSARVDFLGGQFTLAENPTLTYFDVYEDHTSVPLTCKTEAYVKLPTFSASELPMINLTVEMLNNLTTPQQEMVIGNPYPDDTAVISRAATIRGTLKWPDPDLYQAILTNATGGTVWSPSPYTSDFKAYVESPGGIPGDSGAAKYSLMIDGANVMWSAAGTPVLGGGDMVLLPVVGNILNPTAGEYLQFTLVNEAVSYP